jgi:hypothetical protein
MQIRFPVFSFVFGALALAACAGGGIDLKGAPQSAAIEKKDEPMRSFDSAIDDNAQQMVTEGRQTFRYDTFGDEAYWGGQLQLHRAILEKDKGGVGPGMTPRQALELGLKVDVTAVPAIVREVLQAGSVSLDKPETTLELLRAKSVVGVIGVFDKDEKLVSVGITCALCHSTVDDSFATGIGRRLDGWPNRDLNVGAIVALAPNLKPLVEHIGTNDVQLKQILRSWGPGRYDAELVQDGKGRRPDGRTAATVLPAAFGLAGVNLHTYTGWGSVTYWNAYVANTQMHGNGTFFDPRMNNPNRFPLAAKHGTWNLRPKDKDLVTSKLAALHFYQLSIPPPKPDASSYNAEAAARGERVFGGKAKCASCHVPPLYTEPGWAMHTAREMGIDDFQARRSPDARFYRTTPLRGLFTRMKGGLYHDGRFLKLDALVDHYDQTFQLQLTAEERADLIEFLKSL